MSPAVSLWVFRHPPFLFFIRINGVESDYSAFGEAAMHLKVAWLFVLATLLTACGGGGGGGGDSAPAVTSPSVSLIGSYTLTRYDRDGITVPGISGDKLEIGATQIWTNVGVPPFKTGTYTYTVLGGWLQATSPGTSQYGVSFSTDNTMTLKTWGQIDYIGSVVLYETYWEKVSDKTSLI